MLSPAHHARAPRWTLRWAGSSFARTAATALVLLACDRQPPANVDRETQMPVVDLDATPVTTWVPAPDATWTIGGDNDGDAEFNQRNGYLRAFPAPDNRLLVLDGVRLQLRTPDGQVERVMGRSGEGPGEFRLLANGCMLDSATAVVFDVSTLRNTFVDVRTGTTTSVNAGESGRLVRDGCLGDGTFVAGVLRSPAGAESAEMEFRRVERTGRVLQALTTARYAVPSTLVPEPVLTSAGAGLFALFETETDMLRVLRSDGSALFTATVRASETTALRARDVDPPGEAIAKRSGRPDPGDATAAARVPLIDQLGGVTANGVWLRRRVNRRGDAVRWVHVRWTRELERLTLAGDQQPNSRNRVPSPTVQHIGDAGVVMLERDSLGMARFRHYGLVKATPSQP